MDSFTEILLFFTIYSFLGWLIETVFASANAKKLINRGFLTGFFCPIYGFAAVLIIKTISMINITFESYFVSLIAKSVFAIVLVTLLELVTGFFLEKFFNCKWWDYSDNRANFKGYICFKYSILWGLFSLVLVNIVHPAISWIVLSIPKSMNIYMVIFFILYFLTDTTKSVIDALDLRKVIINYSNFSVNKYYDKIIQYKRIFLAFPRLLILNAGIINRDVRSILNDRFHKIKVEFKSRFL